MRIGVVTTSYPRAPDDPAGCFVASHVDWMRRHGHQVQVLCAAAPEPHQPWQPGVHITPVPAPAGLFYAGGAPDALGRTPGALLGAARFSAVLAAAVARRAHGWDAAIAHWLIPCAAAAAVAPSRARLLAIAHSGDVHLARRLGLMSPLAALLAARRARVALVNHELRAHLLAGARPALVRGYLERASRVLPMGIDVARFRALRHPQEQTPAGSPPAACATVGGSVAGPGQPTVLFLGRLVPIKGAHTLVAAARLLPPGARVIIAGDGPERPALARAAGADPRIVLPGEVRGPARDALLAAADVLVVPSMPVDGGRAEGAPVTVLEAMAAGVPVVAARTGGLVELPQATITLVEPGQPAQLAAAIARLTAPGPERAAQLAAASTWVEQQDWEHVGRALDHLLMAPV